MLNYLLKNKKTVITIVLSIILLLFITTTIKKCSNNPSNIIINDTIGLKQQKETIITVNDSLKGVQQELLLTNNKKLIEKLQSENQRLLNDKVNLNKLVLSLRYKEKFQQTNIVTKLEDSLSNKIDSLQSQFLALQNQQITIDSFNKYKENLYSTKIKYKTLTKYLNDVGSIDFRGNKVTDTLSIVSDPFLTIGEIKKHFYSRPKLSVIIGNNNPYITSSNVESIMNIPQKRIQYSLSTIILADKTNIVTGAGLNIKKGMFSVTLGYLITNSKYK